MMENKVHVEQLIIETTRRCNMACDHCLRGDAQPVDISTSYIDRFLEAMSGGIGSIVFTGGEPFLNADAMRHTLESVKAMHIPVYSVYVVTNAKEVKDEWLRLMDEWVIYVITCNDYHRDEIDGGQPVFADEGEFNDAVGYSGISVSRDDYHEPIPYENYLKWRMKSYYSPIKEGTSGHLIDEGRAHDNGIGDRPLFQYEIGLSDEDDRLNVETLYLSAKGEICGCCDLSYDHMAEQSIGNIGDKDLYTILKEWKE